MDIEQFRKAGYAAIDAICEYYTTLHERPVRAQVEPGYLLEQLPAVPPVEGEDMTKIAQDFQKLILPGITHWQHGRFFAYFPSISTFESMLAELYSASVSNPGFNWICSPACTELEQVMMDWMASVLGLDPAFHIANKTGGGVILNSASEAALTAAIAARQDRKGELVMYGSTQTHSLSAKAALILGVTFRAVPVEDDYRLKGPALQDAIEKDLQEGRKPFFVIATIGTTSTGAVDELETIGKISESTTRIVLTIAQKYNLYLHVDAAWAGVALALPEHRERLGLILVNKYADSFCTNLHKWGLVGFDCSLFYVRNRRTLNDALDVTPAFLRSREADAGDVIDYRNWQLALGRRFRSIKVWFVMRSRGTRGFQEHLRKGISQASELVGVINAAPSFQVISQSLSLVVFRIHQTQNTPEEDNLLNQRLHDILAVRHDVFLTQTHLHSNKSDVFCIRIALGGQHTTPEDVLSVWEVIQKVAQQVLEG